MPQPEVPRKIILKDLAFYYRKWPTYDDHNPCVLFLHGWQLSGECWIPIVKYLFDRDLNIYAPDLPGFGRSQMAPAHYTLDDYAEFVEAFIKQMKMRKIIVVGHSFGGRLAIKLIARNPKLYWKLILISSAGLQSGRPALWWRQFLAYLSKLAQPFFRYPRFRMLRIRFYELLGAGDYITVADELKQVFVNVINEDLEPLLPRLGKIPTLIAWGDRDKETPLRLAYKFRRAIPNSELVIIRNAGHLVFYDNPLYLADALSDFIGEPDFLEGWEKKRGWKH